MTERKLSLLEQADELDQMFDDALGELRPNHGKPKGFEDILRRNGVEFDGYVSLDTRSQVVALATGLVGGVLDLAKVYQKGLTNEGIHKRFDSLSKDYIQKVTGESGVAAIDNHRGGRAHRLFGPAHDLTRFFEAIGQIRSGRFKSNFGDVLKTSTNYREGCAEYLAIKDPIEATVVLLLHLIGDFFSEQSLPIPGRTSMAEVHDKSVYAAIVKEFLAGGNLRSEVSTFLSTLSGTVLISLVVRLYRYYMLFAVERKHVTLKALSLRDDLPFQLMQRNAHTVSFVISVAKAGFTRSLMEINYTGFIQIIRSGVAINRLSEEEHIMLDHRLQDTIKEIAAI